ncbi:MAG: hypothetical protein JKY50_00675 [Oleispira sp.]|nr:hypothetical protein [Oleispira sp.]
MKTLEQLNELSENELILAVAIKAGIKHDVCEQTGIVDVDAERGLSFERYNPLTNPSHYMPIAIEHDITIYIDNGKVKCFDPVGEIDTGWLLKAQTGRAVCIAFLLMETDK